MVTTNLIGGLGNNLFQIANLLNISSNLNTEYYIPKNVNRGEAGIHNSSNLEIEDLFDMSLLNFNYGNNTFHQIYNHYDLDIKNGFNYVKVNETDNTIYNGYFQSEKYFKDINIKNYFKINPNVYKSIITKYNTLENNKTLSIHCRFGGDRNPLTTSGQNTQHFHKNVSKAYYEKAYQIIKSQFKIDNILIVTDFPELAYNELSNIIPKFEVIDENTVNSFTLLSSTAYSIIGNSTFSWWASYLNDENKMTICPKTEWFGPGYNGVNTDDLFPHKWICL